MTDKRVIHVNFAERRRWLKGQSSVNRQGPRGAAESHWYSEQFWMDFDRVNADGETVAADVKPLRAGERHAKAVAVGREVLSSLERPVTREKLAEKIHQRWALEHASGLTDIRPFSAAHIRKHVLTRESLPKK